MMSLGLVSMRRKSIDPNLIDLEAPIMTKQRKWLKKELPLKLLNPILKTHSPSKIAELIGIDHNTFIKFLKLVYKINPQDKGYYLRLSYERKRNPKKSDINRIYNERTQQLFEIGKRNPFNQQN